MAGDGTVEYNRESFRALKRKGASKPCLVVTAGPQLGLVFEVSPGETILGRDCGDAKITFTDRGVSRRHAELIFDGQNVTLRDLQSTNGVRVNGERVDKCVLKAGDVVVLSPETELHLTLQESEVSALLASLSNSASMDASTGVLRTEVFLERIVVGNEASIAVLDIDQAGYVAEQHGHLAAHQLSRKIADLIKGELAVGAMLGRFGAGFVLLYPIRALDSKDSLDALRQKIESTHFRVESRTGPEFTRVTISVGVAQLRPPTLAQTAIARAEDSLTIAKRMGRNRVEVNQIELWKSEQT